MKPWHKEPYTLDIGHNSIKEHVHVIGNDDCIAYVPDEKHAELIVKAVNNYQPMLEVLERGLNALKTFRMIGETIDSETIETMEKAIAQAKGNQ